MGIFLRGKSWYYEFQYRGRRYVGRIGPVGKTIAKHQEARIRAAVIEGGFTGSRPKLVPTVEEFSREFMLYYRAKNRASTVVAAEKRLKANILPAFGKKLLNEITKKDVEEYKANRHALGRAPATINTELILLGAMLTKAIERGYITDNPTYAVPLYKARSRRVRFLTHEEEIRLWKVCNPKMVPVVKLVLHTGLRQGEVMQLTWDDIDFERGLVRVRPEVDKGGEGGYIPMNKTLRGVLEELQQKSGRVGRVFHFRNQDVLRISFWWVCQKANIEDFHFHDLRHTFASRLVMAGVPLRTVQELLRHHDPSMTLRYAHLAPAHLQNSVEVLDEESQQ
jgi:integrase